MQETGESTFAARVEFMQSPESVSTVEDGVTILHNLRTRQFRVLNDVGATVWHLLADAKTVSDIVAAVCNEYRLPPDMSRGQVEADVHSLLTQLSALGLVARTPREAANDGIA